MSANNFAQAISVNTNLIITESIQELSTSLGWDKNSDYYRVNLSSRSSLYVAAEDLSANLDLQLLDSNGSILAGSYNHRKSDEAINATLETGTYYIEVSRYNRAVDYRLKFSGKAVSYPNWLDTTIQDVGIRAIAKSFWGDGVIDRNEMIAILRDAGDGGTVDAIEFTDLKAFVANADLLKIPEYVKVLANKVVNGDTANQKYQGNSLGNLSAGSSSTQIENLVNKWFLGLDRPTTSYAYQQVKGSLFQNGVSYQDIKQGQINDCFFLVGLATTAVNSPTTIENMFIDNGDNSFTVRFFRNQVADYVTVDKYLPTDASGYLVYASSGSDAQSSANELWVALAEKAYAQLNESGWIFQDNTNSYLGIGNNGFISEALEHITGKKTSASNDLNFSNIINAINAGELIGFGSKSTQVGENIVKGHAYALVGYNSQTQQFTLFNPWGIYGASKPGILVLSWSELEANFSYWDASRE